MTFLTSEQELDKIDESENGRVANKEDMKLGTANRAWFDGLARRDDAFNNYKGDQRSSQNHMGHIELFKS